MTIVNVLGFYVLGYLSVKVIVYLALDFSSKLHKVLKDNEIGITRLAILSWVGFVSFIVFIILLYMNKIK